MATKKKTKEEKGFALTTAGIFNAFERAIPKGAIVANVLNAAAMLIGSSLQQLNATKQDLHAIFVNLEEEVLKRVKLKDASAGTEQESKNENQN